MNDLLSKIQFITFQKIILLKILRIIKQKYIHFFSKKLSVKFKILHKGNNFVKIKLSK